MTDGVLWSLSSPLSACEGVGSSFSTPGEAANASPNLDRRHASVSTQVRRGSEQLVSCLLRHPQKEPRFIQQHLLPSHPSLLAQHPQNLHPPAWKSPMTQLVALSRNGSIFASFLLHSSLPSPLPIPIIPSTQSSQRSF